MMHGIINIDKPQNMTSHDVVAKLRRILGMKRIGHTGTLDPMATGVLPVCLGSATRITEYLDLDFKTYRCTMGLGMITDTQDIWGNVLETFSTEGVTEERIRAAFEPFHGSIDQKPPMYSAVRVEGRRLYEYAREGKSVDVKSRKIYIKDLVIESIDLAAMEIVFSVTCSKGTYIRTICQDVGMALGTGAVMKGLVRLASGSFTLENAWTLEQVEEMASKGDHGMKEILLPPDYPLIHFGKAVLSQEMGMKFVNGWHISMTDCQVMKEPEFAQKEPDFPIREEYRRAWCLYTYTASGGIFQDGTRDNLLFLGVAFYDHKKYKKLIADKVFYRGQEEE